LSQSKSFLLNQIDLVSRAQTLACSFSLRFDATKLEVESCDYARLVIYVGQHTNYELACRNFLLIRTAHSFDHRVFDTLVVQFQFFQSFLFKWGPPLDEFDRLTCVNLDYFISITHTCECIAVRVAIRSFAFEVMVKDCVVVRLTDTK